jgi:copper oxidase (laccase) domain-containing protein
VIALPEPFYLAGEHVGIDLPGGRGLFTTRRGGFSSGPYASLNLGRWTDDQPEAVERNRASLQEQLGVRFAYSRQVHGARVRAVGGVVGEGVRAVHELGARGPLAAAIGPGAGPCCYEVGEEVHATFAVSHGDSARRGRNLDLKAIARRELERAGVREIHDAQLCTICSPSLFFSHRRDQGITGRQAGIAWLT